MQSIQKFVIQTAFRHNSFSLKKCLYFGRAIKVNVKQFQSSLLKKKSDSNSEQQSDQEKVKQTTTSTINFEIKHEDKYKKEYDLDPITDNQLMKSTANSQEYNTLAETEQKEEKFDQSKLKFIRETLLYKGDDPYYDKLVQRPERGVVWGLGGELIKRKQNFFTKGKWPEPEEVISFIELEQGKDIVLVDLEELGRYDLPKYGIIVSSFSCRHNYKIASSLLKAIKELGLQKDSIPLRIFGRKDDEWVMIEFNNIMVHIFVETAREEIDLEWKWQNPPKDEDVDEYHKIALNKRKKSIFEPIYD